MKKIRAAMTAKKAGWLQNRLTAVDGQLVVSREGTPIYWAAKYPLEGLKPSAEALKVMLAEHARLLDKYTDHEDGGLPIPPQVVTLRGADLRDANLEHADLRGADLRGVDLRGVDLGDTDLRGARFE